MQDQSLGLKTNTYNQLYRLGRKFGIDLPYFLKNGFWAFLKQAVETLAGLAFYIVFARLTTKDIFGEYQFIISILGILCIFAIPGFSTSVLRSSARGKDGDYAETVKKSFFWSLIGVPVLATLGVYFYFTRSSNIGLALMAGSFFFPFLYPFKIWDSFLQGKNYFKKITQFSIALSLTGNAALILAAYTRPQNLLLIILLYYLSNSLFHVWFYFKSLRYVKNNHKDKDSIQFGYFLTRLNILGTLSSNLDKILIGIFISQPQLATYSVGILFTSQIQGIFKNLMAIAAPKYITHKKLPQKQYVRVFIASIFITIVCLVLFQHLIPFLFGDKYSTSIYLSEISIIFFPFFILSSLYRNQFLYSNKKVTTGEAVIFQIFKILSTIAIIPFFGIEGLAFLFGFQYVIVFLSLFILGKIFQKED